MKYNIIENERRCKRIKEEGKGENAREGRQTSRNRVALWKKVEK